MLYLGTKISVNIISDFLGKLLKLYLAFGNTEIHLENMFNIPGGQLVNSDFLPDININQRDKTVKINGEKGTLTYEKNAEFIFICFFIDYYS